MNHLIRAGGLLAVGLAAFIAVQLMPTPDFLDAFGFHTSENNELDWANQTLQYDGGESCVDCHSEKHALWEEQEHGAVACEACHGPATAHVTEGGRLLTAFSRDSCGVCHAPIVGRPEEFPQVDMDVHGGEDLCISCHDPHDPGFLVPPAVGHSLENRSDCSQCHALGREVAGIPSYPVDHTGRSSATCLSCHGDEGRKPPERPAGLFHTAEGSDDCLGCHEPTIPESHSGRNNHTCLVCHGGA